MKSSDVYNEDKNNYGKEWWKMSERSRRVKFIGLFVFAMDVFSFLTDKTLFSVDDISWAFKLLEKLGTIMSTQPLNGFWNGIVFSAQLLFDVILYAAWINKYAILGGAVWLLFKWLNGHSVNY